MRRTHGRRGGEDRTSRGANKVKGHNDSNGHDVKDKNEGNRRGKMKHREERKADPLTTKNLRGKQAFYEM